MKVKVQNRKRRVFMVEIPSRPLETKEVTRMNHNPQTGEVRPMLAEVTHYQTIRIAPGEVVPIDEELLKGPGFKKAIKRDKWLRILR